MAEILERSGYLVKVQEDVALIAVSVMAESEDAEQGLVAVLVLAEAEDAGQVPEPPRPPLV